MNNIDVKISSQFARFKNTWKFKQKMLRANDKNKCIIDPIKEQSDPACNEEIMILISSFDIK